MAHHPLGSIPSFVSTHRTAGSRKSLFPFALALLALAPSTSAVALTSTTTTLTVTNSGSAVTTVPALTVVTLTATVKAGSAPVKPGQVNFCDATATHCTDIHLLGTAQLTNAGTAVMKLRPGIGDHSYKAVFRGTKTDAGSFSSDSTLTVTGKHATETTIAQSSPTPENYTLTATVTGTGWGAGPSGPVSFLDTSNGNAVLGTEDLGAGITSLSLTNPQTPALSGPSYSIAVADFNGDGIPDLVVAIDNYTSGLPNSPGLVAIVLGNGDGTFTVAASSETGDGGAESIVAADFNGDGKPDLAVTNYGGAVTILLGNGNGTFTTAQDSPNVGEGPSSLTAGDFNGDGKLDLALVNNSASTLTILLGKGDGTFTATSASPTKIYGGPGSIASGDFNGDGKLDLAVAYGTNDTPTVSVYLGNGDGTFTAAASPETGVSPAAIAMGDFDGDGNLDLAVTCQKMITILLGKGDGTFTTEDISTGDNGGWGIAVGDFNLDGVPDLAIGIGVGGTEEPDSVELMLGKGDGTFAVATNWQLASPSRILSSSISATDLNGDGVPDLATVDVYTGPSPGVAVLLTQLTQTATAAVTGISLRPNTGIHQVVASYPGDSNYNSSVSGTTGLPTAQLTFSTTSVAFGTQEVGDSTSAVAIYLTNTSSSTQTLSSIKLGGTAPTAFATSNTCGASLTVGAECRIGVRFAPKAVGAAAATITVTDSATNSPQTITLNGTGVSAPDATVSLSKTSMPFGNELVGYSTVAEPIYVTNTSTVTLYFGSITLGGTNASSFVTSNTCGATLAPGVECRIGVRFVPQATGPLSASITVTDNTSTSPQTISLTGTGVN